MDDCIGPDIGRFREHHTQFRLVVYHIHGADLTNLDTCDSDRSTFAQAGCIANDLWDRRFDGEVERTSSRPLARGAMKVSTAAALLVGTLILSLLVVLSLPQASLQLCLALALAALPPILLYPSAKRWFPFPQAVLALCWGFAVLIPWAAAEAELTASAALLGCWLATMLWTFGFDTVYAMADRRDDSRLGLRSSALTLGDSAVPAVRVCYGMTCLLLAIAATASRDAGASEAKGYTASAKTTR